MSNLTYTISQFTGIHTLPKLCIYTNNFGIGAFIHHNLNFKEGISSLVYATEETLLKSYSVRIWVTLILLPKIEIILVVLVWKKTSKKEIFELFLICWYVYYNILPFSLSKMFWWRNCFLRTSKSVSFISKGDIWNFKCHADKQRKLFLLLCEPASPRGVWRGLLATCIHLSLLCNLLWVLQLVPNFTRCGDSFEESLWIYRELMLLNYKKKVSQQIQIAPPNFPYLKKAHIHCLNEKNNFKESICFMSSWPSKFRPYGSLPLTSILTLEWENSLSCNFSSSTLSWFEILVVAVLDKLRGRRHL